MSATPAVATEETRPPPLVACSPRESVVAVELSLAAKKNQRLSGPTGYNFIRTTKLDLLFDKENKKKDG